MRGSPPWSDALSMVRGPSPHMRGSQELPADLVAEIGTIPAYAGEPDWLSVFAPWPEGPSPRMRGSPASAETWVAFPGTIPAYAGEPSASRRRRCWRRDHPRVCGGALHRPSPNKSYSGPSPRMRGSPACLAGFPKQLGTIPAYAGEPLTTTFVGFDCLDHPRVCGGATSSQTHDRSARGPSPRMRGSR